MQTYQGTIVEITGGSVTIDIDGRLGQLKLPLRMIINDKPLESGQIVRFVMSYPEIISEEGGVTK